MMKSDDTDRRRGLGDWVGTMVTTTLLSVEDFEALQLDHGRYELWWGELREMPPNGIEHSGFGVGVSAELRAFVRPRRLGLVTGSDGRFVLDRGSRLVLIPDAAFIATDRLPAADAIKRAFDGASDLAVEVVSPTDRTSDVEEKVQLWLRYGARLVWVLWPATRTVSVRTPHGAARTLGAGDDLDGGEVLPGFRIAVAELFR